MPDMFYCGFQLLSLINGQNRSKLLLDDINMPADVCSILFWLMVPFNKSKEIDQRYIAGHYLFICYQWRFIREAAWVRRVS